MSEKLSQSQATNMSGMSQFSRKDSLRRIVDSYSKEENKDDGSSSGKDHSIASPGLNDN